jgi:hypothetical protein
MNYEPNDSPFGDAYRRWLAVGARALDGLDENTLDEFRSCAESLINRHPEDFCLECFRRTLNIALGADPQEA